MPTVAGSIIATPNVAGLHVAHSCVDPPHRSSLNCSALLTESRRKLPCSTTLSPSVALTWADFRCACSGWYAGQPVLLARSVYTKSCAAAGLQPQLPALVSCHLCATCSTCAAGYRCSAPDSGNVHSSCLSDGCLPTMHPGCSGLLVPQVTVPGVRALATPAALLLAQRSLPRCQATVAPGHLGHAWTSR